jgi:hypothetical protein
VLAVAGAITKISAHLPLSIWLLSFAQLSVSSVKTSFKLIASKVRAVINFSPPLVRITLTFAPAFL